MKPNDIKLSKDGEVACYGISLFIKKTTKEKLEHFNEHIESICDLVSNDRKEEILFAEYITAGLLTLSSVHTLINFLISKENFIFNKLWEVDCFKEYLNQFCNIDEEKLSFNFNKFEEDLIEFGKEINNEI